MSLEVLVLLVLVALAFDFMNGFHDAANAIATIVSTRVLRPQWAVAWAAFFNLAAFVVFGVAVASTIGKGIIDAKIVDHYVIFGALIGAITWNVITWYYGIPSSSSHALIGGLAGAAVAKGGVHTLIASGFLKTAAAIVLSPALGFVLGVALMLAVSWMWRRSTPRRVDRWFRRLQLVSAALYSLGHGGNDAQKTMGIIWMLLITAGNIGQHDPLPLWVVFACYGTIALGTLFGGFCAETAGATTLIGATLAGIPVSTTHTITGAIIGVGATRRLSAVKWGVAGRIVWAWVITIPIAALVSAICYFAVAALR